MATARAFEAAPGYDLTDEVEPLSSADEQANILRAVISGGAVEGPLVVAEGVVLDATERTLLFREARWSRDVRGDAMTLLRARAAEWAVHRRLEQGMNAGWVEQTSLLLDRTLADIGTATDTLRCEHGGHLEAAAIRLQALYEQVTETSLRLAGRRHPRLEATAHPGPAVDENEFEIRSASEPRPARNRPGASANLAHIDDDMFELEPSPVSPAVATAILVESLSASVDLDTTAVVSSADLQAIIAAASQPPPTPAPLPSATVSSRSTESEAPKAHQPQPAPVVRPEPVAPRRAAEPAMRKVEPVTSPAPGSKRALLAVGVVVVVAAICGAFFLL